MRGFVFALVLSLSGAAYAMPTVDQVRDMASTAQDYEVCIAAMRYPPEYSGVLVAEIVKRKVDCQPYWSAEQARLAQSRAEAARAAQALQMLPYIFPPAPAPMQFPRQTNCTSRIVGNQVQTSCW